MPRGRKTWLSTAIKPGEIGHILPSSYSSVQRQGVRH